MAISANGLWGNSNFVKLFVGQTISEFGTRITRLALPLTAVLLLGASPKQMGLLGASQYAPFLLLGLFAGVWADRLDRRRILIVADLGRATLLGFVPVAALLHILRIEHLLIVAFTVGVLTVFFDVTYYSFLPSLVEGDQLFEGNAKLQMSTSAAEVGGPAIAGGLVQLVAAPFAILIDAVSFLVSAASVMFIPISANRTSLRHREKRHMWREMKVGLRAVFANPLLRGLAGCGATANFFIDVYLAVYILHVTRELSVPPAVFGVITAVGGGGGLLAAISASRITKRIGIGPTLMGARLTGGIGVMLIPFVFGPLPVKALMLTVAQLFFAFGTTSYVVPSVALRQGITPDDLIGRVTATMRFLTWGVAPAGFLVGGILGSTIGSRPTLLVAGIGLLSASLWVALSPLRRVHAPPKQEQIITENGSQDGSVDAQSSGTMPGLARR